MTNTQLQLLKTEITNDPALSGTPMNADGYFAVAAALNLPSSPAFTVWRTAVSTSDCKKATVWTEYIGRSAGERDAWSFMLSNGIINAADANVRQGIQDIFSGAQGVASRTALLTISKRIATRAEKVLATGTGSDAAPGTLTFEGSVSYQDVEAARTLP